MIWRKQGAKKQAICYSKREKAVCFFSFWMTLQGAYFGPDFIQGHKPTHVFKRRIVDADWLGDFVNFKFLQKGLAADSLCISLIQFWS